MTKKLGQVSRNPFEDIWVSLKEVHGVPHVELRVYRRSARSGGDPIPEREVILVPVEVLSDLLCVLEQTQERLIKEGLVHIPPPAEVTIMEAGEPVMARTAAPRRHRSDFRQKPRVPLKMLVECRLLNAAHSSPLTPVTGEIKDVSIGGAQVWLPRRFPLFSRVEVCMRIGGQIFRGRAEIVAAALHPKGGGYRHSLRWLTLNDQAKAALSKLIPTS